MSQPTDEKVIKGAAERAYDTKSHPKDVKTGKKVIVAPSEGSSVEISAPQELKFALVHDKRQ